MKTKPDMILVLLAIFGLGVAITLLMPFSSSHSVAEPISPLQAGVYIEAENTSD